MSGIRLKEVKRIPREKFHREWGCPRTKNRTPWCFAMCTPVEGLGECGRIAPHSLMGRTELAILKHKARQAEQADSAE
jgi:hypothetical protein